MGVTVSNPFRIRVNAATPASSRTGTISDLVFERRVALPAWTDPQGAGRGALYFGKHTRFQYCPDDGKIYGLGGDGTYPGMSAQSSGIRFPRFTLDSNLNLTYDNWYPHYGNAGQEFPDGADDHSFTWDSTRHCFWIFGGYAAQIPSNFPSVGIPVKASLWVWRFFPATGQLQKVGPIPSQRSIYGQSGCYVPAIDHIVWTNYTGSGVQWYNCATGAVGAAPTNLAAVAGRDSEAVNSQPQLYDPINNELVCLCFVFIRGIYAIKLDNLFTGTCTVRKLMDTAGQGSQMGQTPMWIRNRRLYLAFYPRYEAEIRPLSGGSVADGAIGGGLGFVEITLDTPTPQVSKGATMMATNFAPNSAGAPIMAINEGDYSPVRDAVVATNIAGDITIYKYGGPPSWVPAAGNVKALTTDWNGSSSYNTLSTVSGGQPAGNYGTRIITAWMSGAYCRDLGCNGAMLFQGGGDGDYWGNEVYAFDFDARRFYRLTTRTTALTGNGSTSDRALPTNHPQYFNMATAEHGPLVPDGALSNGNWGLLPIDHNGNQATQPGVPHLYDGAVWIPGSFIGNERGAFVRPYSKFVYPVASTNRPHYLDLDRMKWGRLTTDAAGNQAYLPMCAFNEADGIIYWTSGYINLANKTQNAANWFGNDPSYDTSMEFDPVRRVLVYANGANLQATNVDRPGSKITLSVSVTGSIWGASTFGGITYCADLDCFFFYNSRLGGPGQTPAPQKIWKIVPPGTNQAAALAGTWQITEITMGGDAIVHNNMLTYGNMAYVRKLKCVAIHIPGGYMYLYRPVGV